MGIEQEGYGTMHVGERTQAMASYARAFFRSMGSEEFGRMIEDARSSGQQWLVERLYSRKVIDSVVRTILGRIDRGRFVGDQLNDYVQDATVVLMQIARQEKLDLTKSAGEIASYVCLWIEQRVKRMARKDQRWRFSLLETAGDVEGPAGCIGSEETGPADWSPGWAGGYHPSEAGVERGCAAEPRWKPDVLEGFNPVGTRSVSRSERNVLSIFGSSKAEDI